MYIHDFKTQTNNEHRALSTAAELIARGVPAEDLHLVLPVELEKRHGAWADAVLAGEAAPDLDRLAALVAAGIVDHGEAEDLVTRDGDEAIWEAQQRLDQPDPGDDPREIRRLLARLKAVQQRRQQTWDKAAAAADYEYDATTTYAAAAPPEVLKRPNATQAEAAAAVEAALKQAIEGNGPRHVLIDATMGTFKTSTALRLISGIAAKRREARLQTILEYRRSHPEMSRADAIAAVDANLTSDQRAFRVRYFSETHELVAATVRDARALGMSAEHHGGYDRGYDPSDETAPAVCSQPVRRKLTQDAGESVPDKACNGCPDRDGCRRWQRLAECGRVEFVAMPVDNAFDSFLLRQLADGFDLTILDESPDRAGYGSTTVPLDYLSDRYFDLHPVRDEEGEPDDQATELARAHYKLIRDAFDVAQNGYAPVQALRDAGFDAERMTHLVELTDARMAPSGITSTTPDEQREELAKASFRRQVGSLCGLFRALAQPEDGWVRLDGDEKRVAIVRYRRTLHPSITNGRVICLDGSANVESWRRFLPDLEVITAPRPRTPHQTAVQIVRPNGKHAMRKPERKAYNQALLSLYANGEVGVLTHQEHEADFAGAGIRTGHYFALAGRNDWKSCSTLFAFGLPFLSPEAAAYEGAARTGEAVQPAMPVRTLRPVMMKGGGVTLVPSMEYQHPAAREAQEAARDRQAEQGPGGRPRASMRTAANPNDLIYVGTSPLPGVEFNCVITGPSDFAPDRFVRMAAAGLVVASGPDRHRLHSEIYPKVHTAEYDMPREQGGMLETLQRVIHPAWSRKRREMWVQLRYWVGHQGNRSKGRLAACPVGAVHQAKQKLRDCCSAVRIELVAEIRRPEELPRIPVSIDSTWVLGSYPKPHRGPLFTGHDQPDDPSDGLIPWVPAGKIMTHTEANAPR